MTHQQQAEAFMQAVSQHQEKFTRYACSLTKDDDEGHDLFMNTMLKCHDRILSRGFHGNYLAYLSSAIKLNFFYARRGAVTKISLSSFHNLELAEEEDKSEAYHALAGGIMSFIASHYSQEEVAVFDLHVSGLTFVEISFVTDYSYHQARRLVKKIKQDIRNTFQAEL